MRNLKSIFLVFVLCFVTRCAYAASVSLAPEPLMGAHSISMGIEYDRVYERELDTANVAGNDEIYESNVVLLKADYALTENYFLYGKIGISDLKFKHVSVGGSDRAEYKVDYDYGPAWALGAKAVYKMGKALRLDFDVQYFGATGGIDDMSVADTKATGLNTDRYLLTELSSTATLGYDLFCYGATITPYAGLRLSRYHLDFGTVNHSGVTVGSHIFYGFSGTSNGENPIGIITGLNFKFQDSYYLNLEGRFIDETAISTALVYGF